jgi:hypothetical protein
MAASSLASSRPAPLPAYDAAALGGHSLKRGTMTTGLGVHLAWLKRFERHKSYAVIDEYLEYGDALEGHLLVAP